MRTEVQLINGILKHRMLRYEIKSACEAKIRFGGSCVLWMRYSSLNRFFQFIFGSESDHCLLQLLRVLLQSTNLEEFCSKTKSEAGADNKGDLFWKSEVRRNCFAKSEVCSTVGTIMILSMTLMAFVPLLAYIKELYAAGGFSKNVQKFVRRVTRSRLSHRQPESDKYVLPKLHYSNIIR